MGLAIPRPAMRDREERVIRARIQWGIAREQELIASGMDQPAATKQAVAEAKALKFTRDGKIKQRQDA